MAVPVDVSVVSADGCPPGSTSLVLTYPVETKLTTSNDGVEYTVTSSTVVPEPQVDRKSSRLVVVSKLVVSSVVAVTSKGAVQSVKINFYTFNQKRKRKPKYVRK